MKLRGDSHVEGKSFPLPPQQCQDVTLLRQQGSRGKDGMSEVWLTLWLGTLSCSPNRFLCKCHSIGVVLMVFANEIFLSLTCEATW